jgi:orc1/cdc6 family replication initiation protein
VFDLAKEVVARASRIYQGPPEVLRDDFQPKSLPFREKEISALLSALSTLVSGYQPPHIVVQGRPGSGKSTILPQVLDALARHPQLVTPFTVAYVHCPLVDSDSAFLREVVAAVSGDSTAGREKRGTDVLLDELKGVVTAKAQQVVLVLDGIDQALPHLSPEFLYGILNLNTGNAHVAVVAVVRDPSFEGKLGIKTSSRFLAEHVGFEAYDEQQVTAIVGERARVALGDDPEVHEAVAACAAYAAREDGGNVRTALSTLRLAAKLAEQEGATAVSKDHVERAVAELHVETLSRQIRGMDIQDQVLLHSILSLVHDTAEGATVFENIYAHYEQYCNVVNVTAFKERAARNRVDDLERQGLVRSRMVHRGRNGGRKRFITPAVSPGEGLRVLDGILAPGRPG